MSLTQQEALYRMLKAERSAQALARYVEPYSNPINAAQSVMNLIGVGNIANTTGSGNIAVGYGSLTTVSAGIVYPSIPGVQFPSPIDETDFTLEEISLAMEIIDGLPA